MRTAGIQGVRTRNRRRILVVGGGPTGLAFATSLHAMLGAGVHITVADRRGVCEGGDVRWRGLGEGVRRRHQVVTLQSLVTSRLPEPVRMAMFPTGGFCEMWPTGAESPARLGFPRNVRILDVENRLLELAKTQGLDLRAERITPENIGLDEWDLIVVSDGSGSSVRDHFTQAFGRPDPTPYSASGAQVVDIVLGLQVRSRMSNASSVIMTIAQSRFLLNARNRDALMYMRLTPQEASELQGAAESQRDSSQMSWRPDSAGGFVCNSHHTAFGPASDPGSRLWPRVLQGLKLFDIPPGTVQAITAFHLGMTRRGCFVAELSPTGSDRAVFGALIGDAAGATHFWPGRGLNRGLSSAYALSKVLSHIDPDRDLRNADFYRFEAVMAALQSRHQDRAWRSMVQTRNGVVTPVSSIIASAIAGSRVDRDALLKTMRERVETLSARLAGRLPGQPSPNDLIATLNSVDDETLAVLVASGPWETRLSGGPEVDVDALLGSREIVLAHAT